MKHSTIAVVIVTLCIGVAAGGQSLTEAQKTFDAGDYKATLRGIAETMSSKQATLPADQRYALLTLKGESLLRIGERTYAIDAFNAAARVAQEMKDFHKAAVAKANVVIIQRSQGALYKSRGGGDGINIVAPDSRVKAMKAAYADLLAEYTDKFKAVLEGTELPPILELVPTLGDLYVLETAATGEAPKTTQILKSFGLHARALMDKELGRVDARVADLSGLANSLVGSDYVLGSTIDRRGLWTPERRELEEQIEYIQKIRKAAQRGRQIAMSFGFSGENWDGVIAESDAVLDRAQELWEHRY